MCELHLRHLHTHTSPPQPPHPPICYARTHGIVSCLKLSTFYSSLSTHHPADYISELRRLEKEKGIAPNPEIDAYLKASAISGKRHSVVTDMVLRLLGLEVCADTVVGNNMLRGVSGGQRRRVTTGEMIVGPTKTLFMDEISTGLDSSTTYLIINCLRNFAHLQDVSVWGHGVCADLLSFRNSPVVRFHSPVVPAERSMS